VSEGTIGKEHRRKLFTGRLSGKQKRTFSATYVQSKQASKVSKVTDYATAAAAAGRACNEGFIEYKKEQ